VKQPLAKGLEMKRLFFLTLTLMMAGCATAPLSSRSLELALDVPLLTVNLGAGSPVFLKVIDDRPERNANPMETYKAVAPIVPRSDLTDAFKEVLGKRLAALGYDILSTDDPTVTRFNVAVRTLSYGRYSTKPQRLHIDASVFTAVYKGETCRIEKAYTRDYTQDGDAADMEQAWFEEKTNRLLSELVEKMLADLELHAALLQ
jgi:uncharacterized lipoprotein YajG